MASDVLPNPGDLVDAIRGPSPRYKRSEVDAIVARGPDVIPGLLEILERVLQDPELYLLHLGDDLEALYAVPLLAHLREPRAHDLLVELARLPRFHFEEILGGFLTEGMGRALFATCGGRTERLRELLVDPSVDEYLRTQAADALAMAVHQGWAERGEVLDFLAAQLVPDTAELGSFFWGGVGSAMLKLHPADHAEVLVRACDTGLIEPMMFGRAHVIEELGEGRAAAASRLAADVARALTPDVHRWIGWWACFAERPSPRWPPMSGTDGRMKSKAKAKLGKKRQKAARKKQRRKKRR